MLALTVLGSGSQGNASVVRAGERLLLIDAGLSPKATRERMFAALRAMPEQATDLLLTHLDADHWRETWRRPLLRTSMRIHMHRSHLREALRLGVPETHAVPFDEHADLGDGLSFRACHLPHDDRGSTAYLIERCCQRGVTRLGFATDLGRVPDQLVHHFSDLDCLAIESNYDHAMEEASDRPRFLKDRVMGGRGHLSNEESLAAALAVATKSDLQAIVLLHLSLQCNRVDIVERLWNERAGHLCDRLTIAEQFRAARTVIVEPRARAATPTLTPCRSESLFDLRS
jgi:phosphoribosyl 1,2-cyclic phosphodiesterase